MPAPRRNGLSFVETYRELVDEYDFDSKAARTIVLRACRGGGLTKDAVYLRGLVEAVDYVAGGGALDVAFVGKLAADDIPVVREMLLRIVLRKPPLRTRYLDDSHAMLRLAKLRTKPDVPDPLELQAVQCG